MPKQKWSLIVQKSLLEYAGLPRGKIGIRAVHHVFNPKKESEETEDDVGPVDAGHLLSSNCLVAVA